jgi:hypothetical protein
VNSSNNDTPHAVFQFQNSPVMRRMNAADTNEDGYPASEMRAYLAPVNDDNESGNFLAGLTGLNNAGVPEDVLLVPARTMSTKGDTSSFFLLLVVYVDKNFLCAI